VTARAVTARRVVRLAAVAVVALAISSCGDDDSGNDAGDSGSAAAVDVTGAWARSSPAGVTDGAAYLTIESDPGDQLIGAAVPASVAATAELHETVTGDATSSDDSASHDTGDHEMESTDDSGAAMTMRQVTMVELPAGEAVAFAPGGLHVMLIDLAAPLESGTSFEITLTFADAEPLTVDVDVRDEAP
jgi:copper(I)-binding protein